MNDLSTIILKSGIQSLIYESDEAFKKSLINSLSFKLNEAIKEVQETTSSGILHLEEKTEINEDVGNFIMFVENYESKSSTKLNFKNNTSINISEQDMEKLKVLFNSLNSDNRKTMTKTLFENAYGLKNTLNFYEMAKKVIK
jgi:ribosomal protein S20